MNQFVSRTYDQSSDVAARRIVMNAWATDLATPPAAAARGDNVVTLQRVA
jgi:hypothetical protein